MTLADTLLKVLVCPISRGPLELVHDEKHGERLFSSEVGVYFPIQEPDIPILLEQNAQAEDGSSAESPIAAWREAQRII